MPRVTPCWPILWPPTNAEEDLVFNGLWIPLNSRTGRKERLGRLLEMHADERTDLEEIRAGDIGAVIGPKNTTTGDTLCDAKHPITLMSVEFPDPE